MPAVHCPFFQSMPNDSNIASESSNGNLRAELAAYKRETNTPMQLDTNVVKYINSASDRLAARTDEEKRWVATSNLNASARLRAIIDDPIPMPHLDAKVGALEFEETDEVLKRHRTKDLAKKALEKISPVNIKLEAADRALLTSVAPIVEYCVQRFGSTLRQIASTNGDSLVSPTNFNALEVSSRKHEEDFETFRLEKNASWNFKVFFRRNSVGQYGFFVICGPTDLTCQFNADQWSYTLAGAPSELATASGKLTELNENTLAQALRLLISIHRERAPVKNFSQ